MRNRLSIISSVVRSNSPLVKNFKLTSSQEDFEFKKLLFNTVVVLSRNPAMHQVIYQESRISRFHYSVFAVNDR